MSDEQAARRWRLVLGRYAEPSVPVAGADAEIDTALGYLYDREYVARGLLPRAPQGRGGSSGRGTLDPSAVRGVEWLARVGRLFPKETFERMQGEAIARYGIADLLTPEVADTLETSPELVAALLRVRGSLDPAASDALRILIARAVDDVVRRLRPRFVTAIDGRRDRSRRSMRPRSQDLDWRRTLRANLSRYDPDSRRLVVTELRFSARARRAMSWDVIVLVDQSGSMASSLLYAAVCAGILTALPGIRVQLLLFDTSVVDVTGLADDPVSVLMTAQLGGGTNIAKALAFAERRIANPARTVVVVVSDFEEGGSVSQLLGTVQRIAGGGVRMLGLAALDEAAEPVFDRVVAGQLADQGMQIAALTPDRFAEWLAQALG